MTALWNDVLQEVRKRKASGERASIFSDRDKKCTLKLVPLKIPRAVI